MEVGCSAARHALRYAVASPGLYKGSRVVDDRRNHLWRTELDKGWVNSEKGTCCDPMVRGGGSEVW